MHEIYTLIAHAELMSISTYYFHIFIYWFISILILLIRSGYIIVSFYYSVSSYIFREWLHDGSFKFQSLLHGYQVKRSQTKQVVKLHILCKLCIKGKFEQSFSLIKMLFSIILPCLNKKKFVKEAIVHSLYALAAMQCLV